ncbi:MAG: Uncharacterized MFS-type transporter, partial [uncultured Nocardioides sp.]
QRLHDHNRHGLLRALLHQPRRERRRRGRTLRRGPVQHAARIHVLLADHHLDHHLGAGAAAPRCLRRPHRQQEGAAGVLRVDGRGVRSADLLRHRRQLAASGRRDRHRQPVLRRCRGHQRLHPPAHLRRVRPRPGLLTRLGVRLPRRRAAPRGQPRRLPRARRAGTQRGTRRAPVHAVGGAVVGWIHPDPLPEAQRPPTGSRRAGGGQRRGPQLRAARRHAPRHEELSDGAEVPAGLPVLQRRHPDRHRVGLGVRRGGAGPLADDPDRHHLDGAVRGVLRSAPLRPAGRAAGCQEEHPHRAGHLDDDRDGGPVPAGRQRRAVPDPGRLHRHRARRHPGAGQVLLLAAHPARQGGGVLQLLPRDGPRHLVVRDRDVRHRAGGHRLLPTGDLRVDRFLRDRRSPAHPRGHRTRHPRGQERPAGNHL